MKDHEKCRNLTKPMVFNNTIDHWPARRWTPDYLTDKLNEKKLIFRLGPKDWYKEGVLYEGDCCYQEATLQDFNMWVTGCGNTALSKFSSRTNWCYLDYRYMNELFDENPDLLKDVDWSSYGLKGRTGKESTIWVGSPGAHTPCHYDTYGYNLVAQIYGRKRWVLFPPEVSSCMYPSRIPYEESSVFSQVNIKSPDLVRHPKYKDVKPYVVTLEPGQVLYVPRQWWHYVESLDTSISINSWIELPQDNEIRLQEAVTRILVTSLMPQGNTCDWLNPTENLSTDDENLIALSSALKSTVSLEDVTQTSAQQKVKRIRFDGGSTTVRPQPEEDEDMSIHTLQREIPVEQMSYNEFQKLGGQEKKDYLLLDEFYHKPSHKKSLETEGATDCPSNDANDTSTGIQACSSVSEGLKEGVVCSLTPEDMKAGKEDIGSPWHGTETADKQPGVNNFNIFFDSIQAQNAKTEANMSEVQKMVNADVLSAEDFVRCLTDRDVITVISQKLKEFVREKHDSKGNA